MRDFKLLPLLLLSFLLSVTSFAQTNDTDDQRTTVSTEVQRSPSSTMPNTSSNSMQEPAQCKLKTAMRLLWEDHIIYTRNYIISALAGLGDVDAVSKRLLKNQDDIGNAIKPYYGDEAGNKLAKLLREHIVIATQVLKAAKSNNKKFLDESQKKWQDNAGQIATFLSSANPNWSKDDLQSMLREHLDLTTGEVTSRLKKDWNADIDYFDKGEEHMMKFSDTLTDGIVKQFPDKVHD